MMNFSMRESAQLGEVDGRARVAKPICRGGSFWGCVPLPAGSAVQRTAVVAARAAALAEREAGLGATWIAEMADTPGDVEATLDVERQRAREDDRAEVDRKLTERAGGLAPLAVG